MLEILMAIAGILVGAGAMYLGNRRLELALRMMLDRREQELAQERARNEVLVERIVSLRQDGYVVSRAGQVRQPPDAEDQALARAEGQQRRRLRDDEFLKNAVAKIQRDRPDVTEAAAFKEARRLLESARMEQPPA